MRYKNKAIKDSNTLKVTKIIVFVIFILYALTLIFPFAWMLMNAFKSQSEYFASSFAFPTSLNYVGQNFMEAITMESKGSNVLVMTLRSLFITVVGVSLSMISSLTISYVVAKYKFIGRNAMYAIIIVIMLIPSVGTTAATYRLINAMGIYDTYFSIFLMMTGGLGFQFLMLHGVFKSISWSYAEAAMVDGASDFRIFATVMVPLAAPTVVPLAIMNLIGVWNDYFTPYLYLKSKPTLAVGLKQMVSYAQYGTYTWPAIFMLMILSMIPILIVFIVFQKQIMSNVTAGGLK